MIRYLALPVAFVMALAINVQSSGYVDGSLMVAANKAEAASRVPASSRGAARRTSRRTTRRVIRRTNRRVNRLPAIGCSVVVVSGTSLHQCGSTYYQPSGNTYIIVNVE